MSTSIKNLIYPLIPIKFSYDCYKVFDKIGIDKVGSGILATIVEGAVHGVPFLMYYISKDPLIPIATYITMSQFVEQFIIKKSQGVNNQNKLETLASD